jgi:hypothetical protein
VFVAGPGAITVAMVAGVLTGVGLVLRVPSHTEADMSVPDGGVGQGSRAAMS